MTIDTATSSVTIQGDGSTTSFSFDFVGVQASDIEIIVTDSSGNQTIVASDLYALTFNAPPTNSIWGVGGMVIYPLTGSPLAIGMTLTINRVVSYTQTTSLPNQGTFYPVSIERALDLLCMQIQQLAAAQGYSVQAPVIDIDPEMILPPAAERAGLYLAFDVNGNVIALAGTGVLSGVAGGDLAGTYPNPTVRGIQGHLIAGTAPTTNQVLQWNGTKWAPATISGIGTVTSVATSGVLTGGPITSSGTVSIAPQASGTLLGNSAGTSAVPAAVTLSDLMDAAVGDTQGSIIYRSGSAWVVLGPGASGQVLLTRGSGQNPVWATATGAVLLNTLTASNSASLVDTTSLTGTFKSYEFRFLNLIPASSGVDLYARFSTNGGISYDAGATSYAWQGIAMSPGSAAGVGSGSTAQIILTSGTSTFTNTASAGGLAGILNLFGPSGSGQNKLSVFQTTYINVSSYLNMSGSGVYNGSTQPVNAIQILMSSGNISSGSVEVWGVP